MASEKALVKNPIGIFKGFTESGREFLAEIVTPYQPEFVLLLGSFMLVTVIDNEALLGRIPQFYPMGTMAGAEADEYLSQLQRLNRPVPEDVKELKLRYNVKIRLLGTVELKGNQFRYRPGVRALPHLGAAVGLPTDEALQFICNARLEDEPDAVSIGYYALGDREFPKLEVKFSFSRLLSKRTLVFSLARVVHAGDLERFNNEIAGLSGGALPKWINLKPAGLYCTEINHRPTSIIEIDNLGGWEYVVTQLSERRDFESEETFFTVVGLATETELGEVIANLRHMEWPQVLPADENRQLVIYHYHTSKSPSDLWLSASVGSPLTLESSPNLRLDCRCDMKKLRIRTGDPIYRSQKTWITLVTKGKLVAEPLELDMTVIVKANFLKRIGLAALIALSLAAAQTISLVTRADLSSMGKLASVLAIFLATLVATVTIVWGIRRRV